MIVRWRYGAVGAIAVTRASIEGARSGLSERQAGHEAESKCEGEHDGLRLVVSRKVLLDLRVWQ